jgi:sporulation-control protein spo0M
LERGENWSVRVERIELTCIADGARYGPYQVTFKHISRDVFYLAPKERTQYGSIIEIPDNTPVTIEALAVLQQQFFLKVQLIH